MVYVAVVNPRYVRKKLPSRAVAVLENDVEAGVAATLTSGAVPSPEKTMLGVTTTVPALGGAPSRYLKIYDADADALLPYIVTSP
jgi:hypothetical protein